MQLSPSILIYASDVLGDTNTGLSGPHIVRYFNAKSIEHSVQIPHTAYPFDAPNKRTALQENLMCFQAAHQVEIIEELLSHAKFENSEMALSLKSKIENFKESQVPIPSVQGISLNGQLDFLSRFPKSQQLYQAALKKFQDCLYERNCLDDLRLCLETFLHDVLQNKKPIEKQGVDLERFLEKKGTSPEIRKMFGKILEHYYTYQNRYVKHDDNVNKEEIQLIFQLTVTLLQSIAS